MHQSLPVPQQLLALYRMELANWCWSWRSMLFAGTLAPLVTIIALGIFARDDGVLVLSYVLTGNVVLSLLFGNMGTTQSRFIFMRISGTLNYYATLPIQRYLLILAVVLSFLTLSLPSLVLTILIGSWVLGVPLHPSPLLLLVIFLCAVPLAGVGVLVGTSVDTPEAGSAINLLITLLLSGLGSIVFPPDLLPNWLVWLGHLNPADYAASALRQTLLGLVNGRFWFDLLFLLLFSIGSFWLVGRKMKWRSL